MTHRGEINALLEQANYDLQRKRLTTPLNNNAYFCYSRVLALDPDNPQAKQGIRNIADQYLAWAIDNANAGNYRIARSYLGKAASLDPDHPNIPAVQKLISEHEHANKLTYYLPVDGLDHRADWVVSQLKDIGHAVTKRHATVVITARNDAEGRWIYQQLNAATPDRVHARLEIGDKPKVRLIY